MEGTHMHSPWYWEKFTTEQLVDKRQKALIAYYQERTGFYATLSRDLEQELRRRTKCGCSHCTCLAASG